MRRIAIGFLSLSLLMGMSLAAAAQDQSASGTSDKKAQKAEKKEEKAEKKEEKAASKHKAMSLTGWVKSEGDKVEFVNDKDKETYTVQNADTVKSHDGKHVKVKAMLDPTAKTMTVENVKDMRSSKQASTKQSANQ